MKLGYYLHKDLMFLRLPTTRKERVIEYMVDKLCERSLDKSYREDFFNALVEREKQGSTGLGRGVAVPHIRIDTLDRLYVVFARSRKGIDWHALDGKKVHFVFLIIGPSRLEKEYLILLAQISRIVLRRELRKLLLLSNSPEEIIKRIKESKLRHRRRIS